MSAENRETDPPSKDYLLCVHAYRAFLDQLVEEGFEITFLHSMLKSNDFFKLPEAGVEAGGFYRFREAFGIVERVSHGLNEQELNRYLGRVEGLLEMKIRAVEREDSLRRCNIAKLATATASRSSNSKDEPGGYYYSTQPFLAYCINHFFYGGIHFAYVGGKFYPYRKPNPKSSNPLLVYQDLYQPWRDADQFDKFITGLRLNLRKGVMAQSHTLTPDVRKRLKRICAKVSTDLFCPIVYRVEISRIDETRLIQDASAEVGSDEYKITDLKENEFDVLFNDFVGDHQLLRLLQGKSSTDALAILENKIGP